MFNYCITYVDKHNNTNKEADSNDLEEDDPFVVKVILGQLKTGLKDLSFRFPFLRRS